MELKINILTCVVVRGRGTDKISITFEGPSPYTYTKTSPSMNFDVTAQYAEKWLFEAFGISPEFIEVIDVTPKPRSFRFRYDGACTGSCRGGDGPCSCNARSDIDKKAER